MPDAVLLHFWKAKSKNAVYLLGPYQKPVHDLALGVCRDLSGRYKFTEKVILIFLSPGTDFLKLM